MEEIKFLSLPKVAQVTDALIHNGRVHPNHREGRIERYRSALHRVAQAQRQAAVIAVEAIRPDDFADSNHQRKAIIRKANDEHAERCLEVFSAICTLDKTAWR